MRAGWKRVFAICFLSVCVSMITGCGAKDGATKAFAAMMQALQSQDKNQVQAYYDLDAMFGELVAENKPQLEATVLEVLKKAEYQVTATEKIDNSTVKLEVAITTLDTTQIMEAFMNRVINLVDSKAYQAQIGTMDRETYQTLMAQQMLEVFEQEELSTATKTIQVSMVKTDEGWILQENKKDFFNTLIDNLLQAVVSLV